MAGENGFDTGSKEIDTEYWTIRLGWIELMISQRKFIEQGSEEVNKKLLKICLDKYNMKIASNKFSTAGALSTIFLMARILDVANYNAFAEECLNSPELEEFSNTSLLINANVINKILNLSQIFLNNK